MATAVREANGGAGVLRLYGNYGGDVMNFDMAGDLVEADGIESTSVALADDVASAAAALESTAGGGGAGGVFYGWVRLMRRKRLIADAGR
jgi:phosphoenolpyruvate---glycerone phosphotransferase subunit DhaK